MSCSNAYNLGYKESAPYKNMSAAAQLLLNWVTEADDIGIFHLQVTLCLDLLSDIWPWPEHLISPLRQKSPTPATWNIVLMDGKFMKEKKNRLYL